MARQLKLSYHDLQDYLFVDKIAGLNTHTPEHGQRGAVEIYEEEFNSKLYVVHRLDKATSGALVFAKSSEAAAALSALFEHHLVEKRYLFLTDQKLSRQDFFYESHIRKEKNQFVSLTSEEPNSKTHFLHLKTLGAYELWEARPQTGKPHQIRLHAQAMGIPILGDADHGGTGFFRLCLHSLSLKFHLNKQEFFFETPWPCWAQENFEGLEELQMSEALQRRERLFAFSQHKDECLRLSHREFDSYRIDQYGEQLWVYWYKESDPSVQDLLRFEKLAKRHNKKVLIRKMLNRGEDPNAQILWNIGNTSNRWQAKENGVTYELRTDSGLSPGLFLDQRENRLWMQEHAAERSVLNLFSYTGGFSLVSALAGAREVCTVDVSANFIDWSKRNFELNGLNPEDDKYEFWAQDSILFLKGTIRRKRKFGVIVCDPPSFGRSKSGVFSISKNFDELMINALYCLERNGLLLFCTNYEKWNTGDLHLRLTKLKREFSFKILPAPSQGMDFELPDQESLMKSIILRKN